MASFHGVEICAPRYGLASPDAGDAILINPAVRVHRHETPVRSCLHRSSECAQRWRCLSNS
jgi:hypothetical protein